MATVSDFFDQFPLKAVRKKTILIHPEDPLASIYYLVSGQVRMYSLSAEGQEISLHLFQAKSLFPIMVVLSHQTNKYFFEAATEIEIRQAPTSVVLAFLKANPDEAYLLLERFSAAIMGLVTRIESLTASTTAKQIDSLTKHLATKSPGKITHGQLANWLGVSRETVSRLKKPSPLAKKQ